MSGGLSALLIVGGLVALVLGWSYLNEAPYRAFRAQVLADQAQVSFSRVIGTAQSSDIGSPWSFIDARTHMIAIAAPDLVRTDRFKVVSRVFGQEQPGNYLVEVDCSRRTLRWFGDGDAAGATELARNTLGEPILGAEGRPLVLIENVSPPEEWVAGLCDHDWSAERNAAIRFMEEPEGAE